MRNIVIVIHVPSVIKSMDNIPVYINMSNPNMKDIVIHVPNAIKAIDKNQVLIHIPSQNMKV